MNYQFHSTFLLTLHTFKDGCWERTPVAASDDESVLKAYKENFADEVYDYRFYTIDEVTKLSAK